MYDIYTTTILFFALVPGVILSLPPGMTGIVPAAVHALVFYVILRYLSAYVPWWGVWILVLAVIGYKVYSGGLQISSPY